jgi:signal transduction histidine kinase
LDTAYLNNDEGRGTARPFQKRLSGLWISISQFGLPADYQDSDRKHIELTNKVIFILTVTSVPVFITGLVMHLSAMSICNFLVLFALIGCGVLIYCRRYLLARVLTIFTLYNVQLVSMILCGSKSGMEDILLTTAMIPMMLLGMKHRKWIIFFIIQCFLYYFIYDTFSTHFDRFAQTEAQQIAVHNIMMPVKVLTLLITMYLLLRMLRDIATEYEAHRQVLEAQRNYYFNLLDNMPIHVITYDRDMRYTYVNRDACKERSIAEWIIGKTDIEYVQYRNLDPTLARDRMEQMKRSANERQAIEKEEEFINRKGLYHAELRGTIPLFDELTGELREYFCYSIDITRRKETEKKLKDTVEALSRANDELRQFGYVVSHDLKTPLRNISTYLQILKRNAPLDDESNDLIGQAVKSVKHMSSMIQDIFMYASSEQVNLQCEQVDVAEMISVICENMASLLDQRKALVKVTGDMPVLYMNRTHALHLFSNLITNAVKYNQSDIPLVEIGMDGPGFYIRDNGIGIKPQYQQQIFELFKRLHTQEEYEGTGVGLSLCQKIVNIYSGAIRVESELGCGSTFYFSLPDTTIDTVDK